MMTTKEKKARKLIKKYSRDFNGELSDKEVLKLLGINRGTYYKYKKRLADELYEAENN